MANLIEWNTHFHASKLVFAGCIHAAMPSIAVATAKNAAFSNRLMCQQLLIIHFSLAQSRNDGRKEGDGIGFFLLLPILFFCFLFIAYFRCA